MPPRKPKRKPNTEPDKCAAERKNSPRGTSSRKADPDEYWHRTASHDLFFKEILRNIKQARLFLQWLFQHKKITAPVDFSRLELQVGSITDRANPDSVNSDRANPAGTKEKPQEKLFTDLLFKAPVTITLPDGKNRDVPIYIFFLLEHKSYNDRQTAFQLLRYQVDIWKEKLSKRDRRRMNEPLPFILPIIVHHGRGLFTQPTNISDLIVPLDGLDAYRPSVPCLLIDIQAIEEEKFPRDKGLAIFFKALKIIFDPEIAKKMEPLYRLAREETSDDSVKEIFVKTLCYMVQNSTKVNVKRMEEMMRDVAGRGRTTLPLSMWDKACRKAKAQGKAEGLAEGLAEGKAEGKAEGLAEGKAEGLAEGRRMSLLEILTIRLGDIPMDIASLINTIKDSAELERLFRLAIQVTSWSDLRKVL